MRFRHRSLVGLRLGAFMAALVLVTNSLIPAMIVHALIDIGSGTLGYWLLRDYPNEPLSLPQNAAMAADATAVQSPNLLLQSNSSAPV